MKQCSKCNLIKDNEEFRSNNRKTCKKCHNKITGLAVTKWRQRTKIKIIEYLGGKCSKCEYSRCTAALHAHHVSGIKEFSLSDSTKCPRSWDKIQEELNKCILLCANCHAETHHSSVV